MGLRMNVWFFHSPAPPAERGKIGGVSFGKRLKRPIPRQLLYSMIASLRRYSDLHSVSFLIISPSLVQ